MTKEEVLKAIRNHCGEIRTIAATLEYTLIALAQGHKPEASGEIDALKDMMDNLKEKADEVKGILGQWPKS